MLEATLSGSTLVAFSTLFLLLKDVNFVSASDAAAKPWSYGSDWSKNYDKCGSGRRQSPVDIIADQSATLRTFPPWQVELPPATSVYSPVYNAVNAMENTADTDASMITGGSLSNTGTAIKFKFDRAKRVRVWGANLEASANSPFVVDQMHMHWGGVDGSRRGSEHEFEGYGRDMALHAVALRRIGDRTAIAVLGFSFVATPEDQPAWQPIIDALKHVSRGGRAKRLVDWDMSEIFPANRLTELSYYRYQGSLTTPPCTEGVTWSVFDEPLVIGRRQLEVFQTELQDMKHQALANNVRPLQPLNGRVLWRVTAQAQQTFDGYVRFEDGRAFKSIYNYVTQSGDAEAQLEALRKQADDEYTGRNDVSLKEFSSTLDISDGAQQDDPNSYKINNPSGQGAEEFDESVVRSEKSLEHVSKIDSSAGSMNSAAGFVSIFVTGLFVLIRAL